MSGSAGPLAGDDTGPSDDELVRRAQAGDRSALDVLLRRHYPRLFAVCRRIVGNEPDAQDAAQEALIAVARGLGSFDHRAKFTTWSHRIAANAALDELRRRKRRPIPADVGAEPGSGPDRRGVASGSGGGAPSAAPTGATGRAPTGAPGDPESVIGTLHVDELLALVPEPFRTALVLRDVLDLDYLQIGEYLGVPPGTVRSRIARGRAILARGLGPSGDPAQPTEAPGGAPSGRARRHPRPDGRPGRTAGTLAGEPPAPAQESGNDERPPSGRWSRPWHRPAARITILTARTRVAGRVPPVDTGTPVTPEVVARPGTRRAGEAPGFTRRRRPAHHRHARPRREAGRERGQAGNRSRRLRRPRMR